MTNTCFEVGKTYWCRSIGDADCIFRFTITRRARGLVEFRAHGETRHCRPTVRDGVEQIFPLGRYSMAPVLRADRHD